MNTMVLKLYKLLDDEVVNQWSKRIFASKSKQPSQVFYGESFMLVAASTCVIAMHHLPSNSLNVSHVGDSPCLLAVDPNPPTEDDPYQTSDFRQYEPYIVTREHKPDQPEELERIKSKGLSLEFVGPERTPYVQSRTGTLNMSRALGSYSLKVSGALISIPNIININLAPKVAKGSKTKKVVEGNGEVNGDGNDNTDNNDINNNNEGEAFDVDTVDTADSGDDTANVHEIEHFSTAELMEIYQTYNTLGEIQTLPHHPPIRSSTASFNVKSLTLGSDGLFETIPLSAMIQIPFARLFDMKNMIRNPLPLLTDQNQIDKIDPEIPIIELIGTTPCFQDPYTTGLKPHLPPTHIGFDSHWNGSPSDALASQVLSHYKPARFASDNITAIVTFL
jgi:serine/threonine protein phosphatase PrpC